MLIDLLVAVFASIGNIVLQALVMSVVIHVARRKSIGLAPGRLALATVMVPVVTVLMLTHMAEVGVWAVVYALVGAAPAGTDLFYFAFVNFSTLGYGDVTPVPSWRLLGPATAMNGILMFGWSTAVIFEVLRLTVQRLDRTT